MDVFKGRSKDKRKEFDNCLSVLHLLFTLNRLHNTLSVSQATFLPPDIASKSSLPLLEDGGKTVSKRPSKIYTVTINIILLKTKTLLETLLQSSVPSEELDNPQPMAPGIELMNLLKKMASFL